MNITIRQATAKDIPLLAKAVREIAATPGFLVSQPSEITEQQFLNTISKIVQTKAGQYLVAECDGCIIGHGFLEPLHLNAIRHVADLTLIIYAGWQDKGVGTLLLKHLIASAKSSKTIEKIELQVRASNTRAIALYKKMGFVEEGCRKKRVKVNNETYIDDILMGLFIT